MAADPRDYRLDITSLSQEQRIVRDDAAANDAGAGRPFVSVHFACCNIYLRVYRSLDGSGYSARCPRCGQAVSFRVGQGGTDARAFVVR